MRIGSFVWLLAAARTQRHPPAHTSHSVVSHLLLVYSMSRLRHPLQRLVGDHLTRQVGSGPHHHHAWWSRQTSIHGASLIVIPRATPSSPSSTIMLNPTTRPLSSTPRRDKKATNLEKERAAEAAAAAARERAQQLSSKLAEAMAAEKAKVKSKTDSSSLTAKSLMDSSYGSHWRRWPPTWFAATAAAAVFTFTCNSLTTRTTRRRRRRRLLEHEPCFISLDNLMMD